MPPTGRANWYAVAPQVSHELPIVGREVVLFEPVGALVPVRGPVPHPRGVDFPEPQQIGAVDDGRVGLEPEVVAFDLVPPDQSAQVLVRVDVVDEVVVVGPDRTGWALCVNGGPITRCLGA